MKRMLIRLQYVGFSGIHDPLIAPHLSESLTESKEVPRSGVPSVKSCLKVDIHAH